MITNFLFFCYLIFISCSVPLSVGIKHAYKNNKLAWASSVHFIATRQLELACVGEICIPISENYGAGTAFVADKVGDESIVMTAAHLCYAYEAPPPQSVMDGMGTIETKFDMSILIGETLIIVEEILVLDDKNDICVFSVPMDIGKHMPLSKHSPRYGEEVWTIGAPAGYFPDSAKPITKGIFSGQAERVYPDDSSIEFFNFSMPTVGGMSGSPILNSNGEVVGLVSAVNSDWHMISFSPTLDQIKESVNLAKLRLKINKQ